VNITRNRKRDLAIDRYLDGVSASREALEPGLEPEDAELIDKLALLSPADWGMEESDLERPAAPARPRRPAAAIVGIAAACVLLVGAVGIWAGTSLLQGPAPPLHQWQLAGYLGPTDWELANTSPGTGSPITIACPDDSVCYAISDASTGTPTALVSNDAGATWAARPLPPGSNVTSGISCPTDDVCAIGGAESSVPGVWMTENAGTTWTFAPSPVGDGSINDLDCVTAAQCTATADVQGPAVNQISSAVALLTTDGGASWSTVALPSGFFPTGPSSLSCSAGGQCVLGGETPGAGSSGPVGVVVYSTDEGETWNTSSVPTDLGVVTGVSCPSAVTCGAIVGGAATPSRQGLIESGDGGGTWLAMQSNGLPTMRFASLSCSSASTCVVGGTEETAEGPMAAITSTGNLGTSWSADVVPATVSVPGGQPASLVAVESLDCPDTSFCVGIGSTAGSQRFALSTGGA
jgi:hypothetical protein